MGLTVIWIVSLPVRFWKVALVLIALATPIALAGIFVNIDAARYVFLAYLMVVLLVAISVLKCAHFDRYGHFICWQWERNDEKEVKNG